MKSVQEACLECGKKNYAQNMILDVITHRYHHRSCIERREALRVREESLFHEMYLEAESHMRMMHNDIPLIPDITIAKLELSVLHRRERIVLVYDLYPNTYAGWDYQEISGKLEKDDVKRRVPLALTCITCSQNLLSAHS